MRVFIHSWDGKVSIGIADDYEKMLEAIRKETGTDCGSCQWWEVEEGNVNVVVASLDLTPKSVAVEIGGQTFVLKNQ